MERLIIYQGEGLYTTRLGDTIVHHDIPNPTCREICEIIARHQIAKFIEGLDLEHTNPPIKVDLEDLLAQSITAVEEHVGAETLDRPLAEVLDELDQPSDVRAKFEAARAAFAG